jgi:nicotinamidase-related amidase
LCLTAADLGYQVVVPTDAVAGTPQHYGAEVLHHTIAMVATLTTSDEIVAAWTGPAQS